jgi:hypothetical protein
MSLHARLERLRRLVRPPRCERHDRPPRTPATDELRDALWLLHPLGAVRRAAEARQAVELERIARPCPECGWSPGPQVAIRAVKMGHDGSVAEDDADGPLADDESVRLLPEGESQRYTRAEALAEYLAYRPGVLAFRAEIAPEDDAELIARLDATLSELDTEIERLEGAGASR